MKNYNAILCDTDEVIAEDSANVRHDKMKRKARETAIFGDTTGCREIKTPDGKTTFYVKPNHDISERLEHYQLRYPDAKIVK